MRLDPTVRDVVKELGAERWEGDGAGGYFVQFNGGASVHITRAVLVASIVHGSTKCVVEFVTEALADGASSR